MFFKKEGKYYILILLVMLIAYAPLSTLHFAMKNDAFSDNFPDKYFLSQALHTGLFPLWNPYMNFGFPIYADPGFAFWNPITWLFSAIGYSAYTLTIEVLLYIYLAGIFMFRLCKWLQLSLPVAFVVACMYMCSGFFIGSIQYINFITAAAFLPLLIQCFLQLLFKPDLYNAVLLVISFAVVASGGHPAIPIAAVYTLATLFISLVFFRRKEIKSLGKFFVFLLLSILIFLLLAAPAIYSYTSVWNFYGRNLPQQNFEITNIGFTASSLLSIIFPFSTAAHTSLFNNDVAMRNAYFSLLGFAAIFFSFKAKSKFIYCFLVTALIMFVLSLGGNFKEVFYQYLPLLKYVRTNGEYRVFTILFLSLISGFGLQEIFKNKKALLNLKRFARYIIAICLIIVTCLFIFKKTEINTVFYQLSIGSFSLLVKSFLEKINFPVALIVSLIITIIICIPIAFLKRLSFKVVVWVLISDLILNAIIYLPVTGVGTTTLKNIQSIYNFSLTGIPIPELIPINNIDTLNAKTTGLIGDITYYNKKIGTTKLTDYPSYFSSTDTFFKSSYKNDILKEPYIFLLSGNKDFQVKKFSSQNIFIEVNSAMTDTLVFLQNYYKFWKAFNNNKSVVIKKSFLTFMSVPVNKGVNKVEFIYEDNNLIYFLLISFSTLIFIVVIVLKEFKKRRSTHASTTSVLLT
jgi:hypothetical protein